MNFVYVFKEAAFYIFQSTDVYSYKNPVICICEYIFINERALEPKNYTSKGIIIVIIALLVHLYKLVPAYFVFPLPTSNLDSFVLSIRCFIPSSLK